MNPCSGYGGVMCPHAAGKKCADYTTQHVSAACLRQARVAGWVDHSWCTTLGDKCVGALQHGDRASRSAEFADRRVAGGVYALCVIAPTQEARRLASVGGDDVTARQ